MRRLVSLAAIVMVAQSLPAQVIVQSGYGFSFGGPRFRVSGFTTGSTTVVPGFSPTFRPWGLYAPAPLIVVVPQPIFVVPAQYNLQGFDETPAPKPRVNPAEWHVLRPVNVPAFPAVPRPALIPMAPIAAIEDRQPDANRESARQVRLAQAAFAADEYGRAAERLTEAIKLKPDEPLPYFLLAQVRFARGEYAESVTAIRDGLKLAPDWPASAFTPKPLYAARPGAFEEQLNELKAVAANSPDDVTVQFALAYQLWVTGDRDAATKIFRRLAPVVKDKSAVEAFLNVAVARQVKR